MCVRHKEEKKGFLIKGILFKKKTRWGEFKRNNTRVLDKKNLKCSSVPMMRFFYFFLEKKQTNQVAAEF
jgi:hypothetical protein